MTKLVKLLAVGAIALSGVFLADSVFAAGYLKLGDIKGESTDQAHKDWIIIQSMSSPIMRATDSSSQTTGMASGKRQHKPLTITKELDKASPLLQQASANGKVFPKVEIHMQASDSGGSRATYLKYELKNVIITSYQTGGSAAGDTVPMETFSLNYEEIRFVEPTAAEKGNEEKPRRER